MSNAIECQCPVTLTVHVRLVRSFRDNELGTEGWCAIFHALRDNPDNKIQSWDLSYESIDPEIAQALAGYVSTSKALSSLKYATSLPPPYRQHPLTSCLLPHLASCAA